MRDIDFKVISAAENSNKFQKNRFWKEKSVEDVVTVGPTAQATLINKYNNSVIGSIVCLQWFQLENRQDHKIMDQNTKGRAIYTWILFIPHMEHALIKGGKFPSTWSWFQLSSKVLLRTLTFTSSRKLVIWRKFWA
jgi:hypothetical protein